MLQALLRRRADAEDRYERADEDIAAALLEGDEARARELRIARRDAAEEADDLAEALNLAERREEEKRRAERAGRLRAARQEAREKASRFIKAGSRIDRALAELERAVADQKAQGRDLAQALARAELFDGGRIERGFEPALRWAVWLGAPLAARLSGVPWTPMPRRRSMAEGVARLVPEIPADKE